MNNTTIDDAKIAELRAHTDFLLAQNAFGSCLFFASKLLTLSHFAPHDVYRLARCHFLDNRSSQAIELMEKHNLFSPQSNLLPKLFLESILLGAQSYLLLLRAEDALRITECVFTVQSQEEDSTRILHTNENQLSYLDASFQFDVVQAYSSEPSLLSLICLQRGKAHELLDNRLKTLYWLKQALFFDAKSPEAVERIVSLQLSHEEEMDVVEHLSALECLPDWLLQVYLCMVVRTTNKSTTSSILMNLPTQLQNDPTLLSLEAERFYLARNPRQAYKITTRVLADLTAFSRPLVLVHVSCLVELGKLAELFSFAHGQVNAFPKQGLSWYCVGAYYLAGKKFELARRYFSRAVSLDPVFLEALVACAHAHAMFDESDRAIAAYRAAQRLFPTHFVPHLGLGMEYLKTNNAFLARSFCECALQLNPQDPQVLNELGVVCFQQKQFDLASKWFHNAKKLTQHTNSLLFETCVFNLGHSLRKEGRYMEAIQAFKEGLIRVPKNAPGHAALGLTHHLNNSPELALECYHVSLGLNPTDFLVEELMKSALQDLLSDEE